MADGDEGEFQCPYCNHDPYTTQGWLDNHIADKHPDEVVDEVVEEEVAEEEAPERPRRTSRSSSLSENPCSNHPDREAVWESDGVTASVVRYCEPCKERYT